MKLDLSIILPVHNRAKLLAHPLTSLRTASQAAPQLRWELIVVDDASSEDVGTELARFPELPITLHRLPVNSGLLAARLAGLARARGDAVFFLDGDDAIDPGKFTTQLSALADGDVVYGDMARRTIDSFGRPGGTLSNDPPEPACADPAKFYLSIQPAPHNPIFRRAYLDTAVQGAFFPPSRDYDPIAETWYYYQLSLRPARIIYVPGAWSIVGEPNGLRLSRAWERQAYASLRLMRTFMQSCPVTPATEAARRRVGLCAFATWRGLPHSFHHFPTEEFLTVWRSAPRSPVGSLGGRQFRRLARVIGPVATGRILKRLQRPAYEEIRTLTPAQLQELTQLPTAS